MLTIGQLAKEAGLNASAIRYYERNGLLPQPARQSGQRRYEREETLRRLQVIDIARRAGFSLDEIKQLDDPRALRELADRKLPEVDALIARAQAMRGWLELARECECSSLDLCALFDACSLSQAENSSAGSGRLTR